MPFDYIDHINSKITWMFLTYFKPKDAKSGLGYKQFRATHSDQYIIIMKELPTNQVTPTQDSSEELKSSRQERMRKKREDRKRRLATSHLTQSTSTDHEQLMASKIDIRKANNRAAAQKTRDNVKKAKQQILSEIQQLRTENEFLKSQIAMGCSKCSEEASKIKQDLQPMPIPSPDKYMIQVPQVIYPNYQLQRVQHSYPFPVRLFFGMLMVLVCALLVVMNPAENTSVDEMRFLQGTIMNDFEDRNLRKELVDLNFNQIGNNNRTEDSSSSTQKRNLKAIIMESKGKDVLMSKPNNLD